MEDQNQIARREEIDKLAHIIHPDVSIGDQENTQDTKNEGYSNLEDPTSKHPKPPFSKQSQPLLPNF